MYAEWSLATMYSPTETGGSIGASFAGKLRRPRHGWASSSGRPSTSRGRQPCSQISSWTVRSKRSLETSIPAALNVATTSATDSSVSERIPAGLSTSGFCAVL